MRTFGQYARPQKRTPVNFASKCPPYQEMIPSRTLIFGSAIRLLPWQSHITNEAQLQHFIGKPEGSNAFCTISRYPIQTTLPECSILHRWPSSVSRSDFRQSSGGHKPSLLRGQREDGQPFGSQPSITCGPYSGQRCNRGGFYSSIVPAEAPSMQSVSKRIAQAADLHIAPAPAETLQRKRKNLSIGFVNYAINNIAGPFVINSYRICNHPGIIKGTDSSEEQKCIDYYSQGPRWKPAQPSPIENLAVILRHLSSSKGTSGIKKAMMQIRNKEAHLLFTNDALREKFGQSDRRALPGIVGSGTKNPPSGKRNDNSYHRTRARSYMKHHASRNQSTESGYGVSYALPLMYNSRLFKEQSPGRAAGRSAIKKMSIVRNQATMTDYLYLRKFINKYNKISIGNKENLSYQIGLLNKIMIILNKELAQSLEENEYAKRLHNGLIGEVRDELKHIYSELKVDIQLPAINYH